MFLKRASRLLFFVVMVLIGRGLAQNFGPQVTYPTQTAPIGVAKGDFNHDGNQDVIVTNFNSSSLSLLLGKGDGTFEPAQTIPVGAEPIALVVADFNGDGNLDVAVALFSQPLIQVLYGNGDGTFQPPVSVPVPRMAVPLIGSIVTADFNEDGHPDLAVSGSGGIQIFLNNGQGGFTAGTTIIGNLSQLLVADFNQDGHPDLAYISILPSSCGAQGIVFIAFGNGDGTFQPGVQLPIVTGDPSGMAAADLNRDGRLDLVVSDLGLVNCAVNGSVQVALQQADGSFNVTTTITAIAHPGNVIVGDFDGDGNPDLAVLQSSVVATNPPTQDAVVIFPGDGSGNFSGPHPFDVGSAAVGLISASLTNTSALDLVVTDEGANTTSVLVNQGANTLALSASSNPATIYAPVTLTATVQPKFPGSGTLSGTITFTDGGKTLGSGPVNSSGVATLTVTFTTAGTHALHAVFSGNASFIGGSSANLNLEVDRALPPVTLSGSPNPSVFGQPVTFSVAVLPATSGATPTGSVNLISGGSIIGGASLDNAGRTVISGVLLPVGTSSITALYSGDGNYTAATSSPLLETVNKSATTASLVAAPNPSIFGQVVTLTATVAATSGGAGVPSGVVTFGDGASSLGTAILDNSGKASLAISSLAAGNHPITASYSGDGSFLASASSALSQTVNKSATSTTLSATPNPSVFGQTVTLAVMVTASGGGAGIPSGVVNLLDGGSALGTVTLDNTGKATFTVNSLSVASHNLTARYGGDVNFLASTATTGVTQIVNQSTTVTTLSYSPSPAVFGQAVTLTALVIPAGGGTGVPTGSVSFSDSGASIGQASIDPSGKAVLTTSSLSVGPHAITATYTGDANFLPSASAAGNEIINKSPTTAVLTANPNPAVFGQNVTFTVMVAASGGGAGTPTGTVSFTDGTTVLGQSVLDPSGRATLAISSLGVGSHTISASYGGDAHFNPSSASGTGAVTQVVKPSSTATVLSSSINPSVFGQTVTLTAFVAASGGGGGTPSGAVTFGDGTASLGSAPIDGTGKATISVSSLAVGVHRITASYGGDTNFLASSSPSTVQTVNPSATTTVLSQSPDPSVFGQAVILSVAVTASASGAGTPSGTVIFSDGGTSIGQAALDASGKAVLSVASLSVGTHNITASYPGDPDFLASTSAAGTQTVSKSSTVAVLTAAPNPAVFGQNVVFTVVVAASGGGSGTPSGTVSFTDGQTILGQATLDQAGKASLTVASLGVGSHVISASYGGDKNFNPSSASGSGSVTQIVNPSGTATALSSSINPSVFGQAVTLTASVAASGNGAGIPSGTVNFTDGGTLLGGAMLDSAGKATLTLNSLLVGSRNIVASYGGSANYLPSASNVLVQTIDKGPTTATLVSSLNPATNASTITLTTTVMGALQVPSGSVTLSDGGQSFGTSSLDARGIATFTLSSLALGSHSFTAAYGGDANFVASQSPVLHEVVVDSHSAVSLTSSSNPQTVTEAVTFAAVVTPALGGHATGGTVIFTDGKQVLATVPVVNSSASFTTSQLLVGDHSIVATYQAANTPGPFDGASSALLQTINPASPIIIIGGHGEDFTLSIQQMTAQVPAGTGFTTQIVLTPVKGLTGTVTTICAGFPPGSTCAINSSTATLDGKTPVTATLAITTTGPAGSVALLEGKGGAHGHLWLSLGTLPAVLVLLPWSARRKRRLFGLVISAVLLAGCGGGKFETKPLTAVTPPGTYTITVQSQSGSLTHSSQITLTIK